MSISKSSASPDGENKVQKMITKSKEGAFTVEEINLPEVSNQAVKDMVKVFKLLSDETRLRILIYLTRKEELHVRALCDILGQSQPAVSHHLALLKVASLVECRREGKHNFYRIVPHRFQEMFDLLFDSVPESDRSIRFEDYVLSYAPH